MSAILKSTAGIAKTQLTADPGLYLLQETSRRPQTAKGHGANSSRSTEHGKWTLVLETAAELASMAHKMILQVSTDAVFEQFGRYPHSHRLLCFGEHCGDDGRWNASAR
jgi:hypothetical protein